MRASSGTLTYFPFQFSTTTIYVRETSSPFNKSTGYKGQSLDHTSETGRLGDEIKLSDSTKIKWTPDSKGFFYLVRVTVE